MSIARYKKWSGADRQRSLNLTNKAKAMGLLRPVVKCEICGQTEGIIQMHNEDYDVTLEFVPKMIAGTATAEEQSAVHSVLKHWCWRCHMLHHSKYRAPLQVRKYFEGVAAGQKWPPVYRHDFNILKTDHGVP